jgi:hypothetical protein
LNNNVVVWAVVCFFFSYQMIFRIENYLI